MQLNTRQIINTRAKLNHQLFWQWCVLPKMVRGKGDRWYDNVRQQPMLKSGSLDFPRWTGHHGRPGGFGSTFYSSDDASRYSLNGITKSFAGLTELTVTGWIHITIAGLNTLVIHGSGFTGPAGHVWSLRYSGTNLIFSVSNGSSTISTASAAVSLSNNIWYHFAGTWHNDGTLRVYLNGLRQAETTGGVTVINTSAQIVHIGHSLDVSDPGADGYIDDVNIILKRHDDAGVFKLYSESREGHPTTWNWFQKSKRPHYSGFAAFEGTENVKRPLVITNGQIEQIQDGEDFLHIGTANLDFGAFPGSSMASVDITGQTDILTTSFIRISLRPEATDDHSADEHLVETISVNAGNIIAGTGFTIYGVNTSQKNTPDNVGTLIYGVWKVNWEWR